MYVNIYRIYCMCKSLIGRRTVGIMTGSPTYCCKSTYCTSIFLVDYCLIGYKESCRTLRSAADRQQCFFLFCFEKLVASSSRKDVSKECESTKVHKNIHVDWQRRGRLPAAARTVRLLYRQRARDGAWVLFVAGAVWSQRRWVRRWLVLWWCHLSIG